MISSTVLSPDDARVIVGALLPCAILLALAELRRAGLATAPVFLMSQHRGGGDEITQPLPAVTRLHRQESSIGNILAAARTDTGRARKVNEDDTLVAELSDERGRVVCGLYIVADGMGGHEKGEVASRTAIEAALESLQNNPFFVDGTYLTNRFQDEDVLDVLRDAVAAANRAVYKMRVGERSDMGTTIVLAMVLGGKVYIANVGDSRAYLIREGYIRQLTEDHSLVERMVATGQISEAEARMHPQRNVIFRWLGTDVQVEADMFVERLQPYDRLLLCSDGLNSMVPDAAIGHIAAQDLDLDHRARLLIQAANDAGGRDNISVILVETTPPDQG